MQLSNGNVIFVVSIINLDYFKKNTILGGVLKKYISIYFLNKLN